MGTAPLTQFFRCFGVLTAQTASYYHAFPNDKRPLKLAVGFLCACVIQSLYWWFVTNYRNPLALKRATWEFGTYQLNAFWHYLLQGLATSHRRNVAFIIPLDFRRSPGVASVCNQCQSVCIPIFSADKATATGSNILLEFQVIVKETSWLVEAWLTIQAIADVVIATCMCLLLRHRRTGLQKTNSVINRMVFYTINTGLVTSILSCICLGMFAKYGFHFSAVAVGMVDILDPVLGNGPVLFYQHARQLNFMFGLAVYTLRTALQTRLAAPGALELINYAPKKRRPQSTGDYGSESFTATRIHVATEVVCNGDIDPTAIERKVRGRGLELFKRIVRPIRTLSIHISDFGRQGEHLIEIVPKQYQPKATADMRSESQKVDHPRQEAKCTAPSDRMRA
ncbi:hypothetical protein BS47DRAFT_1359871 [Hydnum rufescens UP504]|uniref:DUF6534 domain-containing protein n=1 Tax=Hydnum rufescens UP504 TaxID=1448309 RepID=A0A9P6B3X4_9AGAM|nr:hypothetical protein BS47DRAFT_1359871 [Hydnum rufescens UP504]